MFEYLDMVGKHRATPEDPYGMVDANGYLIEHSDFNIEWLPESEASPYVTVDEENKAKVIQDLTLNASKYRLVVL